MTICTCNNQLQPHDRMPGVCPCPHGYETEACWTCTPLTAFEVGYDSEWTDIGGEG